MALSIACTGTTVSDVFVADFANDLDVDIQTVCAVLIHGDVRVSVRQRVRLLRAKKLVYFPTVVILVFWFDSDIYNAIAVQCVRPLSLLIRDRAADPGWNNKWK